MSDNGSDNVAEKARLLLVDDEPHVLRAFARILSRTYDVAVAENAAQAREHLAKAPFDAVLSDQRMPRETGVSLLTHVREAHPETVRILFTASDEISDLRDAVNQAGVHRFLTKPVRAFEIEHAVDESLKTVRLKQERDELTRRLEEKTRHLEEALASLQEHERNLEAVVERRTEALREANAELSQLALRDGLTGLYNHRFFQEAIETELHRARRYGFELSVLLIDVDHFKHFNDRNGHPAGDAVLREVANRIAPKRDPDEHGRHPRRRSDVAARYGGEEFVLILPQTGRDGALICAETLRQAVAEISGPGVESQPLGHLSVSVGVATFPLDATTKEDVVQRADEALYAAKAAGRNCVVPASSMLPDAVVSTH